MIRKRRYISGIPGKEKERRRNTVTTGKEILRESLKKGCPLFFFAITVQPFLIPKMEILLRKEGQIMTITEYIHLIIATNGIINSGEALIISENKEEKDLLRLCTNDVSQKRLTFAWEGIIAAVAEKFKDAEVVVFFPEEVLNFLIDNGIAVKTLSQIRLPEKYLRRIFERDSRYWETCKVM